MNQYFFLIKIRVCFLCIIELLYLASKGTEHLELSFSIQSG